MQIVAWVPTDSGTKLTQILTGPQVTGLARRAGQGGGSMDYSVNNCQSVVPRVKPVCSAHSRHGPRNYAHDSWRDFMKSNTGDCWPTRPATARFRTVILAACHVWLTATRDRSVRYVTPYGLLWLSLEKFSLWRSTGRRRGPRIRVGAPLPVVGPPRPVNSSYELIKTVRGCSVCLLQR